MPEVGAADDSQTRRALERAHGYCLRSLTSGPRTQHELRAGMLKRGFDESVIDTVMERLRRERLVDDGLYAQLWVDSRVRSKSLARGRLRTELIRKGIQPELIDSAIEQIDPEQERARAVELARARIAADPPADWASRQKVARRVGAMLVRRGYSEALAWSVVSAELDTS